MHDFLFTWHFCKFQTHLINSLLESANLCIGVTKETTKLPPSTLAIGIASVYMVVMISVENIDWGTCDSFRLQHSITYNSFIEFILHLC